MTECMYKNGTGRT